VSGWQAVTARGGRFLEAPLLGNKQLADSGQLVILAAGDHSVYEDCSSCFEAVGKRTFFLGNMLPIFFALLELLIRECREINSQRVFS